MNQKVIKSRVRRIALRQGFRSGLEKKVADILNKNKIKWDYEKHKLKYEQVVTHRKLRCSKCECDKIIQEKEYLPDFYLRRSKTFWEVKGRFTLADRQKMLAVKKHNPDVKIVMVFQDANRHLHPKNKKTKKRRSEKTYSDWCIQHNIPWKDIRDL